MSSHGVLSILIACGGVRGINADIGWNFGCANIHSILASIIEGTAGGQMSEIGYSAIDGPQTFESWALDFGNGIEQSHGIRMARICEEFAHRRLFHDPARVHDQ